MKKLVSLSLFVAFFALPSNILADTIRPTTTPTPTRIEVTPFPTFDEEEFQAEDFILDEQKFDILTIPAIPTENGMEVMVNFEEEVEFRIVTGDECEVLTAIDIKSPEGISGRIIISNPDQNPTDFDIDKTYGFCEVRTEDIEAEEISNVGWYLRADRNEIEELGYNSDEMKMFILSDDEWAEEETFVNDESDDNELYTYSAQTASFENGVIALAEAESTVITRQNMIFCGIAVFGVLLLLAAAVVFLNRNRG